jgi:hypothetical protein
MDTLPCQTLRLLPVYMILFNFGRLTEYDKNKKTKKNKNKKKQKQTKLQILTCVGCPFL